MIAEFLFSVFSEIKKGKYADKNLLSHLFTLLCSLLVPVAGKSTATIDLELVLGDLT